VTFDFSGAARGFMIMSCAARGVKKVGQRWSEGSAAQRGDHSLLMDPRPKRLFAA